MPSITMSMPSADCRCFWRRTPMLPVYMDFSGYTDMAIGSGALFNINLTQTLKDLPSTSVMEFCRCWHISFSRWILDYIFTPLQWSSELEEAWDVNRTACHFLISGIWHGASWCFIAWGLLHGLFLATSIYCKPYRKRILCALRLENTKILEVWQMIVTFHLICLAWIFFRANTIADAFYVVTHLFSGISEQSNSVITWKKTYILTLSLFTA